VSILIIAKQHPCFLWHRQLRLPFSIPACDFPFLRIWKNKKIDNKNEENEKKKAMDKADLWN